MRRWNDGIKIEMVVIVMVCCCFKFGRRKWDEHSGEGHRGRGSETGSPLHSSRDRGRVPLPYPAEHREARPYPDDRWR